MNSTECLFEKESMLSLYSVFHVLFNNIDYVKGDKIKSLCQKYKNYMSNIFKKIKAVFT